MLLRRRFTRPHTMLGTAVSVTSVSALALGPGQAGGAALVAFLQALSSALLMNVCIVGINQVLAALLRIGTVAAGQLQAAAGHRRPSQPQPLTLAVTLPATLPAHPPTAAVRR